ncbi:MAG: RND transporter, partial [Planctomycetota bacterium]
TSDSQSMRSFWIPSTALVPNVRGLWAVYVAEPTGSDSTPPIHDTVARVAASNQAGVPGIVALRDVQVIRTAGTMTYVTGLLQASDQIIVAGTHRIGPGVHVLARSEATVSAVDIRPESAK